jgi:hypothetical protein
MTRYDRFLRVSNTARDLLKTHPVITTDMVAYYVNCSPDEARPALEILGNTGTLKRISPDRFESTVWVVRKRRRSRWRT